MTFKLKLEKFECPACHELVDLPEPVRLQMERHFASAFIVGMFIGIMFGLFAR